MLRLRVCGHLSNPCGVDGLERAAGLANIGLAIGSAYGFGSYIGLLFSPLMSVLPFIMIGIGVDGMFVLQSALDQTDVSAPIEERMAYTLSSAGACPLDSPALLILQPLDSPALLILQHGVHPLLRWCVPS